QGSVGASGDLAPLAHLALSMIGEGECLDEKSIRIASAEALRRAQIKPLVLEAKEAVSLINGTQGMLALGVLALIGAETLVDSAVDNPLVFPARVGAGASPAQAERSSAASDGEILSGGNFHGEPIAFVLDFLGIALSALAGISERRLERLVNPALNEGLPPF